MQKDERDLLEVLKPDFHFEVANQEETTMTRKRNAIIFSLFVLVGVALILLPGLIPDGVRVVSAAAAASYTITQVSGGGTIAGKILYSGKPVRPKRFPVTQDVSTCGKTREVYPVKIEQGGVTEAVVWLDDITGGKAFNFPEPVMDQKNCEFVPHVLLIQPGAMKMLNTDLCSHSIHVLSSTNREVNLSIPPKTAPTVLTLMRPDQAMVRCEIHKWMEAYVIVAKNAYYVLSGAGGAYTLTDVPPGKYHIKVWQETLGTRTQEVTVETGKTATVSFNFGSK
ncbi:MAG TPA: carboxypeptidase regulatory-like domain-containing protein [Candidatus Acidoferrales bacterium]